MENKRIHDSAISISSRSGASTSKAYARLNHPPQPSNAELEGSGEVSGEGATVGGAWCAATDDANRWIQVDLGVSRLVSGVVMQGKEDEDNWVTKYKVLHSHDGGKWVDVADNNKENNIVRMIYNPDISLINA